VVGGHFAFLALERACGGKAVQALGYLDEGFVEKKDVIEEDDGWELGNGEL